VSPIFNVFHQEEVARHESPFLIITPGAHRGDDCQPGKAMLERRLFSLLEQARAQSSMLRCAKLVSADR
jgi:hypothetical protein